VISGFVLGLRVLYQNVLSGFVKVQCVSTALVTRYEHRLLLGRKNTEVKTRDLPCWFLQVKIFVLSEVVLSLLL